MGRYVRANCTTNVTPTIYLNAGELWAADDPFVVSHPQFFDADLEPIVRRTTPPPPPPVDDLIKTGSRGRRIETTDRSIEVST